MNNKHQKKLHYLTQHRDDLPPHEKWLSPEEASILASLQFPKRRLDWTLGRWTAKTALNRLLPAAQRSLSGWQIVADRDGAPLVRKDGCRTTLSISLSHSGDLALCVLVPEPMQMGCDLETVEVRSRSFEETFFTVDELTLLETHSGSDRASLVTLIWSAKESALKALRTGLKADTRRVSLKSFGSGHAACWKPLAVEDRVDGRLFRGWWLEQHGMMMTVLSDQLTGQPIAL